VYPFHFGGPVNCLGNNQPVDTPPIFLNTTFDHISKEKRKRVPLPAGLFDFHLQAFDERFTVEQARQRIVIGHVKEFLISPMW